MSNNPELQSQVDVLRDRLDKLYSAMSKMGMDPDIVLSAGERKTVQAKRGYAFGGIIVNRDGKNITIVDPFAVEQGDVVKIPVLALDRIERNQGEGVMFETNPKKFQPRYRHFLRFRDGKRENVEPVKTDVAELVKTAPEVG